MKPVCLILILICPTALGVFSPFPKSGTLTPKNPKLCTTQDVTFTYTPDDPSDLGDVRFIVNGDQLYNKSVNASEGSVSFTIKNVTRDLNNANIYCCSGDCCPEDCFSNIVILKVFEIPREVENFSCKVSNYVEAMNCSWDLGVDYNWKAQPSFQWRIPTLSKSWNNCPQLSESYCYWNGTIVGDFTMKTIDIQLVLENSWCNSKVFQNYTLDTRKLVQPLPVMGLSGSVINSTCINVTWSADLPANLKIHRLLYDSRWNNSEVVILEDKRLERSKDITLCDLHPATEYTVVVMMMPKQGGYWSEPRSIKLLTEEDFPTSSPSVIPWAFSVGPRVCDASLRRQVTIHWLPLPETHHNGRLLAYVVTSMVVNDSEIIIEEAPGDRLLQTTYLRCDKTYIVSVQPRNSVGKSFMNSTITIPAVNKAPPQLEFIMEMENETSSEGLTEITLTLKGQGQNHDPFNYTVLWCKEGWPGYCAADKSLKWTTFSASLPHLNVKVTSPESLLLGVSMDTEVGRSEVTWQSCVHTKYAVPSREPRSVSVRTGPRDKTLVVTWDKIPCAPGQPYIQKYVVKYCKADKKGHCSGMKHEHVGAEVSRVELPDLEAEATYKVAVQGITRDGQAGPLSENISGVPVDNSLQPSEIAGISIGSLTGLIFVMAGFIAICRYCKKTAKKQLEPPPIDDIPIIIDDNGSTPTPITRSESFRSVPTLGRQWSTDSGVPSSPTSTKSDSFRDRLQTVDEVDYVTVGPDFVINGLESQSSNESHTDQADNSVTPVTASVPVNPVSGYVQAEHLAAGINRKSSEPEPPTGDDKGKHAPDEVKDHDKPVTGSTQDQSIEQLRKHQQKPESVISSKSRQTSRNSDGSNDYVKAVQVDSQLETPSTKHIVLDTFNNLDAHHNPSVMLTMQATVPVINSKMVIDWNEDRNPSESGDFGYSGSSSEDKSINSPQEETISPGYVSNGQMSHIDQQLSRSDAKGSLGVKAEAAKGVPNEEDIAVVMHNLPNDGELAQSTPKQYMSIPNNGSMVIEPAQELQKGGYVTDATTLQQPAQNLPNNGYVTDPTTLQKPGPDLPNNGYVTDPSTLQKPGPDLPNNGYVTDPTTLQKPGPDLPNNGYVTDPSTLQKPGPDLPNNGYVTDPTTLQKPGPDLPNNGYVTEATTLQQPAQNLPNNGYVTDPTTLQKPGPDLSNNGYVTDPTTLQKPGPDLPNNGYVTDPTTLQKPGPDLPNNGYVTDPTTLQKPGPDFPNNVYVTDPTTLQKPAQDLPNNGYVTDTTNRTKSLQGLPNIDYVPDPTTFPKHSQNLPSNGYVTDPSILQKPDEGIDITNNATDIKDVWNGGSLAVHLPELSEHNNERRNQTEMTGNVRGVYVSAAEMSNLQRLSAENTQSADSLPEVQGIRNQSREYVTETLSNLQNDPVEQQSLANDIYVTEDQLNTLSNIAPDSRISNDQDAGSQGVINTWNGYVSETDLGRLGTIPANVSTGHTDGSEVHFTNNGYVMDAEMPMLLQLAADQTTGSLDNSVDEGITNVGYAPDDEVDRYPELPADITDETNDNSGNQDMAGSGYVTEAQMTSFTKFPVNTKIETSSSAEGQKVEDNGYVTEDYLFNNHGGQQSFDSGEGLVRVKNGYVTGASMAEDKQWMKNGYVLRTGAL